MPTTDPIVIEYPRDKTDPKYEEVKVAHLPAFGSVDRLRRLEAILSKDGDPDPPPVDVQLRPLPGSKRFYWTVSFRVTKEGACTLRVRDKDDPKTAPSVSFSLTHVFYGYIHICVPGNTSTGVSTSPTAAGTDGDGVGEANYSLAIHGSPTRSGITAVDGSGNWTIPFVNLPPQTTCTLHVYDVVDPIGDRSTFTTA
jgi:hypothetical protein